MEWIVKSGDIIDEPADVLICSANPFLNLSGGVGGSFLMRYGSEMQDEMHAHLIARGVKHVPQGTVVRCSANGSPYRFVLHAVAVDGMYESSKDVIQSIVRTCLQTIGDAGAESVALTALATGFGNLSFAQFAEGVKPLKLESFSNVKRITIVTRKHDEADEIKKALAE